MRRLAVVLLIAASLVAVPRTNVWALMTTTFATHSDLSIATSGSAPYAVATGDFRGIGRSDIAVTDRSLNKVSVFLSNGNGTFASRADYSLPSSANPQGIAVGDFNGDGHLDLAVADYGTNQVSILLGSAAGTFATHVDYSVATLGDPSAIAVGDFNGDGKPDLAVTDYLTSQVSVLLNSGTGTFPTHTDYSLPTSATPKAIAVGDFNGDGHPDVAVADFGINKVSVFFNSGTGTFSSRSDTSLPFSATPSGIAVGDFNGDGKQDLAVADSGQNEVSVLAGSGTGSFTAQGPFTTGLAPYGLATGDFNNDGLTDVVTANNSGQSASVLLNTTATPPAITSVDAAAFNKGQAGSFTVTTTGTTPSLTESGTLPSGVTFVDNGNGTATLSGTPASAGTYQITITAANSAGSAAQTFNLSVLSWYNAGWLYRKPITISHAKVSAGQTNFPVLVSITDPDLITKAQAGGNDILFTSADGVTKLNHQIEAYTSGTGALVAWVKVPSLSALADTVIYLYYGNASATNQQNATGVWDANYSAVWHLSENPTATAPQFKDSTSNADHGTAQGSMTAGAQVSGKIDGSLTLDGVANYVSSANQLTVPNSDTVEAWFKTTTASGIKFLGFEDIQTGTGAINYDRMLWVGTDGPLRFGMYDGAFEVATSGSSVTNGVWHHAVGVGDNTAHKVYLYLDGVLASSISTGTTPQSYTGYWRIGGYQMYSGWINSTAGYFPGGVDEARISTVARSSSWITTEYNNESSPSTFSTLGTEQSVPSITSASSATFTVGVAGTFTVSATGAPTPSLTESGALPTGVTFTDDGNSTATLAGTPASAATVGTYTVTVTAATVREPVASPSHSRSPRVPSRSACRHPPASDPPTPRKRSPANWAPCR